MSPTTAIESTYNQRAKKELELLIDERDNDETVYHVHGWSQILSPSIFSSLLRVANRTVIHAHDYFLACPNGAFMDYRGDEACARIPLSANCLLTNCDKRSVLHKAWRVSRHAILNACLSDKRAWKSILLIHAGMTESMRRAGFSDSNMLSIANPATRLTEARVAVERNSNFLFIGRVIQDKGVEDYLEAARKARVRAEIIGDGPDLSRLQAKYSEASFHGWCDPGTIAEHLATARCVVMPSRYPEPFGLVAAEALLSGVPVITNQSSLLGAQAAMMRAGFACNTRNVAEFSDMLEKVSNLSSKDMFELSSRCFDCAKQFCNSESDWIDRLIEQYQL